MTNNQQLDELRARVARLEQYLHLAEWSPPHVQRAPEPPTDRIARRSADDTERVTRPHA